ncbi:MAG: KH domain-containing protein [Desulfobacteraceae bacterium]|nr:KH domain-containing protein [Desulfobacteraceae bacterium]
MDQLVSQIAQSLVDRPQDVLVNAIESNNTMVLELRVAKEDIGKVIGKQGRTAQAMRTIIGAVSSKIKKHAVLEILE